MVFEAWRTPNICLTEKTEYRLLNIWLKKVNYINKEQTPCKSIFSFEVADEYPIVKFKNDEIKQSEKYI